jgi:hypothetical protein
MKKLACSRFLLAVLIFCSGLTFMAGCSVNVGGVQRPLVRRGRIEGEIELVAEKRDDEQKTGQESRKSEVTSFQEWLRLRTTGDIYHPNFLLFNAAIGLGLTQQDLDSDLESDKTSDSLADYDLSAQLFRLKPYPITVYANKSEDLIPRQYLSSLRSERESSGASISILSEEWPMTIQYSTTEVEQNPLIPRTQDFFIRKDERFAYSLDHDFSQLSHLSFNFERNESHHKRVGSSRDIRTDRYVLSHDLLFGPDARHRLDSFFAFTEDTGDSDSENLRWQERLRLQHTPNFSTDYSFSFSDTRQENVETDQVRLQAGFEHRLYESLITRGSVFFSEFDFDGQTQTDQQGGTLGFNYRKKNPWGLLLGSYTASLVKVDQSAGGGTGVVLDESHIYLDPDNILLDRRNIDMSTIVVTDNTGLIIYIEGDDYTIVPVGDQVELDINPFGSGGITDGQELLVDYTFFSGEEKEEDTCRQNLTLRQRFDNGLSLYYRFEKQDEQIKSTIPEITPDEFTTNTFGVDYAKGGLLLQAEYTDQESTKFPLERKSLSAAYTWRPNVDTTASVRVAQLWQDFGGLNARDVDLFTVGGSIASRLTDRYSILGSVDYRDEEDTLSGTTEGFQLNAELRYNYRKLSVSAGIDLDLLSLNENDTDSTFIYLRVRRVF